MLKVIEITGKQFLELSNKWDDIISKTNDWDTIEMSFRGAIEDIVDEVLFDDDIETQIVIMSSCIIISDRVSDVKTSVCDISILWICKPKDTYVADIVMTDCSFEDLFD